MLNTNLSFLMKKQSTLLIFLLLVSCLTLKGQNEYLVQTFKSHKESVLDACFSPNDEFLLTSSADKMIHLFDLNTGKLIKKFERHYRDVNEVEYIDSLNFISGGDININKWNIEKGDVDFNLEGHRTLIWTVALSADKTKAFSGSFDKIARYWDLENQKQILEIKGHAKNILATEISTDGKYLFTGSRDRTIKQWNSVNGALVKTFKGHMDNVFALKAHPSGKYFASASKDYYVFIWDLDKTKPFRKLEGHKNAVMDIDISKNGLFLVSASFDGTIILWDFESGKIMHQFKGHKGPVNSVAFNNAGNMFVSTSIDKTARIWRVDPEIIVNFYFKDKLKQEFDKSGLFLPRNSSESRKEYNKRVEKADSVKAKLVDRYYHLFLKEHDK